MGIFDDAIREHLDLKRRQGVDESELKQLEDEAFGLPARPGDPDFPETGESEAASAEEPAPAEAEPPAAEAAEAAAPEQAEAPSEEQPQELIEEQPEAAAPTEAEAPSEEAPVADPADETPPHGDALLADESAAPESPAEEAPVEDQGAASFSTTEREAIASQPTEFFDQAPEPLELGELDLDLEEEVEPLEEPVEPQTGEEPVEEPPPADEEEEASPATDEQEAAPAEDEAEDVLEETPEFLQDNPDDDELWFEQGEPKDFDF